MSSNSNLNLECSLDFKTLPGKVFRFLLFSEIALIILDYFINYLKLVEKSSFRKIFNMAKEGSLANWFSSTLLMALGLVILLIYWKVQTEDSSKKTNWFWAVFGSFFIFLSIDDAASVHERVGKMLASSLMSEDAIDNLPSYGWQFSFVPIYGIIGILLFLFIWKEMQDTKLRTIVFLGLAMFVLAIRIDYYEGIDGFFENIQEAFNLDRVYTVSHYSRILEEFLEMFGTTCILYASMSYLSSGLASVSFSDSEIDS